MKSLTDQFHNLFFRSEAPNRIPVLDGLKAFSILVVVMYHIFWMLSDYMSKPGLDNLLMTPGLPVLLNLNTVIDLFFLIAAFLSAIKLIQLFEKKKFHPGIYIFERITRFLPVLAVAIALYTLAGLSNPGNCWANLLYVNIFFDYQSQCMIWSWYLSVQEQYLLFIAPPVIFLLLKFPRISWWVLVITGGIGVYLFRMQAVELYNLTMPIPYHARFDRDVYIDFFTHLYTLPHTRMLPLLAGSILGWSYVRTNIFKYAGSIRLRWTIPALAVLVIFILPGFILVSPHHGRWDTEAGKLNIALFRHSSTAIYALLVLFLLSNNAVMKPLTRLFSARIWYPFSAMSLHIYLFHLIIIDLLYRIVIPKNPGWIELLLYFFITLIASLILGIATSVFLERNLKGWIYKFLKRMEERALAQ